MSSQASTSDSPTGWTWWEDTRGAAQWAAEQQLDRPFLQHDPIEVSDVIFRSFQTFQTIPKFVMCEKKLRVNPHILKLALWQLPETGEVEAVEAVEALPSDWLRILSHCHVGSRLCLNSIVSARKILAVREETMTGSWQWPFGSDVASDEVVLIQIVVRIFSDLQAKTVSTNVYKHLVCSQYYVSTTSSGWKESYGPQAGFAVDVAAA